MNEMFDPTDVAKIGNMLLGSEKLPCNIHGFVEDLYKTILQMQIEINELKVRVSSLEGI